MKRPVLELCVDTPEGLAAAIAGGADRVELTNALFVGGLTPSAGFMRLARETGLPVMALIRPRAGDFVFSEDEIAVMERDIAEAGRLGLAGVVLGAARPDGTLDTPALERLVAAAGPLETCLHRVFDLTPDPFAAIDQAVAIGFARILTSGLKARAPDALDLLAALRAHAGDRIAIMAGSGITPDTVEDVLHASGVNQIHCSCTKEMASAAEDLVRFGFAPAGPRRQVDAEMVAAMRRKLAAFAEADTDAPRTVSEGN